MSTTLPVGVIVVNWNGRDDTLACLDSIAGADPAPARIVVVDNASNDDSLPAIRAWAARRGTSCDEREFDDLRTTTATLTVLRSPVNHGFSGANNAAMRLLGSDPAVAHVLLLNNDATIAPDLLARLEDARAAGGDACIIGPTIYRQDPAGEVWYAGSRAVPLRALVSHELRVPASDVPVDTAFVTGCAMFISGAALRRLGGLPECYAPGYLEDAEYCWRARAEGVRVLYAPAGVAYHKVGVSFARVPSPRLAYTLNRNRVFFVRRNFHGVQRRLAMLYLAITKPARAALEVVRGRPALGMAVLRGVRDGFLSAAARR